MTLRLALNWAVSPSYVFLVLQLREKREEEEEKERSEDATRREREHLRQRRAAEEELLERERQMVQQAGVFFKKIKLKKREAARQGQDLKVGVYVTSIYHFAERGQFAQFFFGFGGGVIE